MSKHSKSVPRSERENAGVRRMSGGPMNRASGEGARMKLASSKRVPKEGASRDSAAAVPRRMRGDRQDGAARSLRIFVENVRDRARRCELRVNSRLTKIEVVRQRCGQLFSEPVENIQLYHGGKKLEDHKFLYDYGIKLDNTLMMHISVRPSIESSAFRNQDNSSEASVNSLDANDAEATSSDASGIAVRTIPAEDDDVELVGAEFPTVYKEGDIVDVRQVGVWHEATVQIVAKKKTPSTVEVSRHGDGSVHVAVTVPDMGHGVAEQNGSVPVNGNTLTAEKYIALCQPVVDTRSDSLLLPGSKKQADGEEGEEDDAAAPCSIADDESNSTVKQNGGVAEHNGGEAEQNGGVSVSGNTLTAAVPQTDADGSTCVNGDSARGAISSGVGVIALCQPVIDTSDSLVLPPATETLGMEVDVVYYVQYLDRSVSNSLIRVGGDDIRPRALEKVHVRDLRAGDKIMVSYNVDDERLRGDWYDACVAKAEYREKRNRAYVTLVVHLLADNNTVLQRDCKIVTTEIYKIPEPGTQRNIREVGMPSLYSLREVKPYCEQCNDDVNKQCDACSCTVCKGKNDETLLLVCEECHTHCHTYCLQPSLAEVPEDDWYCASCKNDADIVRAGEEPRISRRQANAPSANPRNPNRDWDQGMACTGRTKTCTVVPSNHFGKIPGTRVGMSWKYRMQAAESGIHVLHVGGIHGRSEEGAFSICLAGGYEGDVDHGDWFYFTGSGGRDLKTGNKRTLSKQTSDQKLTMMNLALARNITDQPLNQSKGAKAKDWKSSKPVRVLRSAGCSKYGPAKGHRYDGIYRVVRYFPEKSKSGFRVWRYELRRDDDEPAPWTDEGKAYIKKHNLEYEIPDHQKKWSEEPVEVDKDNDRVEKPKKRKAAGTRDGTTMKKERVERNAYKPGAHVLKLIKDDELNARLWIDVLATVVWSEQEFLQKVSTTFQCSVCHELVTKPITMECSHNVCQVCLKNAMRAQVFSCPQCRHHLGRQYQGKVNDRLCAALGAMFPTTAVSS